MIALTAAEVRREHLTALLEGSSRSSETVRRLALALIEAAGRGEIIGTTYAGIQTVGIARRIARGGA